MRQIEAEPYPWPFDGAFGTSDTGLLLLGFQTRAVHEHGDAGRHALRNACVIGRAWHARGGRTLTARRGARSSEDLPPAVRRRNEGRDRDQILFRDNQDWQLAFEPFAGDAVIDHRGDSVFYGTDLEHMLRTAGIDNLLITGLPTDGIVHATMRDANDRGFECLLVADACACHDPDIHDGILGITMFGNGLFGTVAPTAAVLSVLE